MKGFPIEFKPCCCCRSSSSRRGRTKSGRREEAERGEREPCLSFSSFTACAPEFLVPRKRPSISCAHSLAASASEHSLPTLLSLSLSGCEGERESFSFLFFLPFIQSRGWKILMQESDITHMSGVERKSVSIKYIHNPIDRSSLGTRAAGADRLSERLGGLETASLVARLACTSHAAILDAHPRLQLS